MKRRIFIFLIVVAFSRICSNNDTITVKLFDLKLCYTSVLIQENKCLINGKRVSYNTAKKFLCYQDSLNKALSNAWSNYLVIIGEQGQRIEEGIFYSEFFTGDYKSYSRNGKIASSGKLIKGKRVGEWVFYDKSGKESKRVTYNLLEDSECEIVWKSRSVFSKKMLKKRLANFSCP